MKSTTPGNWIVTTTDDDEIKVVALNAQGSIVKTIARVGSLEVDGKEEDMANAAILSASKDMLDVLIAIQETLITSKGIIDLEHLNAMLSDVFEKIAVEAGEI